MFFYQDLNILSINFFVSFKISSRAKALLYYLIGRVEFVVYNKNITVCIDI